MSGSPKKSDSQLEIDFAGSVRKRPGPGELDIAGRIKTALRTALSHHQYKRRAVAGEIGDLAGREVSAAMQDKWCAEEAEAYHLPAHLVPAVCCACRDFGLLKLLCEAAGGEFLAGEELDRLELIRRRDEAAAALRAYEEQCLRAGIQPDELAKKPKAAGRRR